MNRYYIYIELDRTGGPLGITIATDEQVLYIYIELDRTGGPLGITLATDEQLLYIYRTR